MSQPRVVRFDVYDVASDCSQFFSAHRRHRHDPREAQHLCWSELQPAEIAAATNAAAAAAFRLNPAS